MPGEKWNEDQLKVRFSKPRIRGEWFRPDPELLTFIEKETAQFCYIKHALDPFAQPEQFTRFSLKRVVRSNALFDWKRLIDTISHRLQVGETQQAIVASSELDFSEDVAFCGWMKCSRRGVASPTHHLLFVKGKQLYRYSPQFDDYNLPPDVRELLRPLDGSCRCICLLMWRKCTAQWLNEKTRLFL
jgi:hypothetical protein